MIDFDKMYNGSYYTIEGAGGDINEWKEGYQNWFDERGIGKIKEWFMFSGKDVNDYYGFVGKNRYPDDLTILTFPLDDLDIGKLAMFKLQMGDRWFDDIIDNTLRRN